MPASIFHRLKRSIPARHPVCLLWHRAKAFAAALRYGFPARRLTVIGVTGTDGKTTTVAMIAHILHACGASVGAASTSFFRIREQVVDNPTHMTSLSPFHLQEFLRRCLRSGCTIVVVEASSHGLVQHRIDFLWPHIAAITNTSPEHLDYHGTMEQYRHDKGILFRMLRGRGVKILNRDDETHALYRPIPSKRTITYGTRTPPVGADDGTHLWISDTAVRPASSSAVLHLRDRTHTDVAIRLELGVPGDFNLLNAQCAIGAVLATGVQPDAAARALSDFKGVPGRIEPIDEGQPFSVFVDFTVTPASYERTLDTVRRTLAPGKRLLVLTSSCGDRMREKRPQIGKICSERADVVVVTEDETITEDPLGVIDEIWAGIDQSKTDAHRIPARREAIRFLFAQAHSGDAVILCGMGACVTMQTRDGLRPWNEREIARELLREQRTK